MVCSLVLLILFVATLGQDYKLLLTGLGPLYRHRPSRDFHNYLHYAMLVSTLGTYVPTVPRIDNAGQAHHSQYLLYITGPTNRTILRYHARKTISQPHGHISHRCGSPVEKSRLGGLDRYGRRRRDMARFSEQTPTFVELHLSGLFALQQILHTRVTCQPLVSPVHSTIQYLYCKHV